MRTVREAAQSAFDAYTGARDKHEITMPDDSMIDVYGSVDAAMLELREALADEVSLERLAAHYPGGTQLRFRAGANGEVTGVVQGVVMGMPREQGYPSEPTLVVSTLYGFGHVYTDEIIRDAPPGGESQ